MSLCQPGWDVTGRGTCAGPSWAGMSLGAQLAPKMLIHCIKVAAFGNGWNYFLFLLLMQNHCINPPIIVATPGIFQVSCKPALTFLSIYLCSLLGQTVWKERTKRKPKISVAFLSLAQFREQRAEQVGCHWVSDDLQVSSSGRNNCSKVISCSMKTRESKMEGI